MYHQKRDENQILSFIEPIFRFCYRRVSNRYDAEDLAGEIICHVLEGLKKYEVQDFEAWVWRIAHNRYARFVEAEKKRRIVLTYGELPDAEKLQNGRGMLMFSENFGDASKDYCDIREDSLEEEYASVFRYLHTLSAQYRNIFVDYYLGQLSVRQLSQKYSLPETTIKWRLNVGREKIRKRMEKKSMDKVYQRINWNTTCCNGSIDTDRYLHAQISRAICKAAYEKPLTVEEISLYTGIPAMYIEDELPRLEYGDAIRKIGEKYATDFIIFSQENRKSLEDVFTPLVGEIADYFEKIISDKIATSDNILERNIHRTLTEVGDFGISRLGSILVPYILRKKIREIQENRLHLASGNYPPRKDGGYGWFIVEESANEQENMGDYATGCNSAGDDSGSRGSGAGHIYYYWMSKYFDREIYHNGGTRWLCAQNIVEKCKDGRILVRKEDSDRQESENAEFQNVGLKNTETKLQQNPKKISGPELTQEQLMNLMRKNLVVKDAEGYRLNFPCFMGEQFTEFVARFEGTYPRQDAGNFQSENVYSEQLFSMDDALEKMIWAIYKGFKRFVPKRLEPQINQWVTGFTGEIIGYVLEELFERGVLEKPEEGKPFVNGVFYVEGKYLDI